jgi:ubiquinone biosynthesis protein
VLQLFLRHALRDGYFHADMHQGNLKVAVNGDMIALDFGIMGRIDEYTRRVYAEILYRLHPQGLPPRRRGAFRGRLCARRPRCRGVCPGAAFGGRADLRHGCDADLHGPAARVSVRGHRTLRDGDAHRADLLLQRTMVVVEGVSRSLNPRINMWEMGRPVVEDYIRTSVGPRALARDLRGTLEVLARFGPKLPGLAEAALIRQTNPPPPPPTARPWRQAALLVLGAVLGAGGVLIGVLL